MIKHFNITVSGKVQGVFYRQSTLEFAKSHGIKGFVKNQSNGDVYIEAEAEEGSLNKFTDWCKRGPDRAEVKKMEIQQAPLIHFTDFSIKR